MYEDSQKCTYIPFGSHYCMVFYYQFFFILSEYLTESYSFGMTYYRISSRQGSKE